MEVLIFSRKEIEEELKKGLQSNVSIISFCDIDLPPVDFSNTKAERIICKVNDIYYDDLADEGYTYEDFFPEAPIVAEFIDNSIKNNQKIICQCEYGESRSAGCAAAILQYYENCGIKIFADFKRLPSQLIYHKIFDSLQVIGEKNTYKPYELIEKYKTPNPNAF